MRFKKNFTEEDYALYKSIYDRAEQSKGKRTIVRTFKIYGAMFSPQVTSIFEFVLEDVPTMVINPPRMNYPYHPYDSVFRKVNIRSNHMALSY